MKKLVAVLFVIAAGLLAAAYIFRSRLESEPPQVTLSPATDVLGLAPLEVTIADRGSGLKSVAITLSNGGAEIALLNEQYPRPVPEKKLTIAAAKIPGVKEGPAVLRISARDASLWHMLTGNEPTIAKPL